MAEETLPSQEETVPEEEPTPAEGGGVLSTKYSSSSSSSSYLGKNTVLPSTVPLSPSTFIENIQKYIADIKGKFERVEFYESHFSKLKPLAELEAFTINAAYKEMKRKGIPTSWDTVSQMLRYLHFDGFLNFKPMQTKIANRKAQIYWIPGIDEEKLGKVFHYYKVLNEDEEPEPSAKVARNKKKKERFAEVHEDSIQLGLAQSTGYKTAAELRAKLTELENQLGKTKEQLQHSNSTLEKVSEEKKQLEAQKKVAEDRLREKIRETRIPKQGPHTLTKPKGISPERQQELLQEAQAKRVEEQARREAFLARATAEEEATQ